MIHTLYPAVLAVVGGMNTIGLSISRLTCPNVQHARLKASADFQRYFHTHISRVWNTVSTASEEISVRSKDTDKTIARLRVCYQRVVSESMTIARGIDKSQVLGDNPSEICRRTLLVGHSCPQCSCIRENMLSSSSLLKP